eukprot:2114387-Rhodomonas_salina.1
MTTPIPGHPGFPGYPGYLVTVGIPSHSVTSSLSSYWYPGTRVPGTRPGIADGPDLITNAEILPRVPIRYAPKCITNQIS